VTTETRAAAFDSLGRDQLDDPGNRFPLPETTILLLVGAALGPAGIAVLTPRVLTLVDPAIPVALAALGVLLGARLSPKEQGLRRVLAAAGVEAVFTGLTIGVAAYFAATLLLPGALDALTTACVAGVCAATSSAALANDDARPGWMRRVRDLDVLFPILAAGLLTAWLREPTVGGALSLVAQACGATVIMAAAGWLLLSASASATEQRIIIVAVLLLVGGLADYLALPALLGGVVAGLVWQRADARVADLVHREIGHVQHPLLALILLVAGARMTPSVTLLILAAGYLALRAAAKAIGGRVAVRLAPGRPGGQAGALMFSGALGVAFAVNAYRIVGPDIAPMLTVVILGTIGSELLALPGRVAELE
jgi:hypothetical protein